MVMEPNYNIVVIGMGFIGKFLLPGYRKLLGDKVETNVFGTRNNPEKVAELQKLVPFKVSAGNNLELLREKRPDIVIMSTPPKAIPVVAQEVLKPYFEECRKEGRPLPDIYSFGPTPAPQFYLDLLGDDINVVKFLPSMAEVKQGINLPALGAGFVVFGKKFPEDREKRVFEFSNCFSNTFALTQDQSLYGLSSKNTVHTVFETTYAIEDAMKELGYEVSTKQIASAWRAAFRKHTGLEGDGLYPCSLEDVPECIRGFIEKLSVHWYEGVLRYILSMGCDEKLARAFHGANFEVFALTGQLLEREETFTETQHHATKGGVTEKAVTTYMQYFDKQLRQAVKDWVNGELNPSFFDTAEGIAYTIDMTVNRHAYRLADRK